MSMCHRCGEHRSNCICTPSKSEAKRLKAMDAPERTLPDEIVDDWYNKLLEYRARSL